MRLRSLTAPVALALAGLLAGALLVACAGQPGPSEADLAMARSISPAFMKAAEAKDAEAAAALYSEDAMVMPPGAPAVKGRAAIEAFWRKMMLSAIRRVTLATTDLGMSGDIAYETGTYTLDLTLPDGSPASDGGKYITLMRRQADGSWKMTHDMWSSDAPAPASASAQDAASARPSRLSGAGAPGTA